MEAIEPYNALPVGTATVERSFSQMKLIKTRLRSRLSDSNLEHLMKISIEDPPLTDNLCNSRHFKTEKLTHFTLI